MMNEIDTEKNEDCAVNRMQDKLAYLPDEALDGEQRIEAMFKATDSNGKLYIPGFFYDDDDESNDVYELTMNWKPEDRDKVIKDYKNLCKSIKTISGMTDMISEDDEINKKNFPPELFEVLYNYIRDFEPGDYDELCRQATERIGGKYKATYVICMARRLCKFYSIDAPEVIIEVTKNFLAASMAVNRYAEKITVIK